MYKVFINDKPIIFVSSFEEKEGFILHVCKGIVFEEIIHRLSDDKIKGVFLFSSDINTDWQLFLAQFKIITAAGGLVANPRKELLFIYRSDKWDLPKGRIEKGESIEEAAVREVEEECGIYNLSVECFLLKTYHIFFWNKEVCIKETYWYSMYSDYSGVLIPQKEEGITKAVFKNEVEVLKLFTNTYANINLVYQKYKSI